MFWLMKMPYPLAMFENTGAGSVSLLELLNFSRVWK